MISKRQRFARATCLFTALLAKPVWAAPDLSLSFPGPAVQTVLKNAANDSFAIATGGFQQGRLASLQTEGAVRQRAWRVTIERPSTLDLMQSLRDQIIAAGYKVMFTCEADACGGFDFRFAINILPEPEMHVDLGDFRYLAAERSGPQGQEYLTLIVSRSPQDGFVQLTQIGGAASVSVAETVSQPAKTPSLPAPETPVPVGSVAQLLDQGLPAVLEDLDFPSGSGTLAAGDYASLRDLAAWLLRHPEKSALLVGHTDASGSMAANVALSKQRAASVRAVLVQSLGVPQGQIGSDGVGPLAPRSEDQTPEGRTRNRRVEVILTPTQ